MCLHNFLGLHSFVCVHVWADVMQRPSVHQQYPPSAFFAAHSQEAGPLCVCQPCSLAPIVKLNKLVCSGRGREFEGSWRRV